MADAKKRFLIVPDEAWSNATLVSATSQAGLTVKQPETDTALGDMRVVVSGEPTEEFSTEITVRKGGTHSDFRYLFDYQLEGQSVSTQQWLRSITGFACRRPDFLINNGESAFLEPIGFLEKESGEKVLLYQRIAYRADTEVFPANFSGSPGVRAFTMQPDYTWSSSSTSVRLQGFEDRTCFAQSRFGAFLVTVSRTLISTTLLLDNLTTVDRYRFSLPEGIAHPYSCALSFLPSGRLLLAVGTKGEVWAYTSDDLGVSWQRNLVLRYSNDYSATDIAVSLLAADDSRVYLSMSSSSGTYLYESSAGEAWAGGLLTEDAVPITPCVDPEGRVCFLYTGGYYRPRYATGDIRVTADPFAAGGDASLHYAPSDNATKVAVCAYRGNLLVASGWTEQVVSGEAGSESNPLTVNIAGASLSVLCLSERHNLLERPAFLTEVTSGPDGAVHTPVGRQQSAVWLGYQLPDDTGWQPRTSEFSANSSFVLVDGEPTTGYMRMSVEALSDLAWEASLLTSDPGSGAYLPLAVADLGGGVNPIRPGSLNTLTRFVVRGQSGGSILRDEAALRWYITALSNDATTASSFDLSFRMQVVGTSLVWRLYDNIGANTLAVGTIADAANVWYEFIVGTVDLTPTAATRLFSAGLFYRNVSVLSDRDPFVDLRAHGYDPYVPAATVTKNLVDVADSDYFRFGHMTVLADTVWDWKSVLLSRGSQAGIHYPTVLSEISSIPAGAAYVGDTGIYSGDWGSTVSGQATGSRGNMLTSVPSFFLEDVYLSSQGRWLLTEQNDSSLSVETEYVQAATNVLPTLPVMREYRSEETQAANSGFDEVSMVYELSGPLTGTALALFGRNTPSIRIQGHSSNTWGSPLLDVQIANPYDNLVSAIREYGHLYVCDKATSNFLLEGNRVRMAQRRPWRAHQFKSQDTGQQFYAVLYAGFSQTNVYRIIDNTDNMLQLDAPNGLYSSATHLVIYSDRVAFDLGTAVTSLSTPITHIRVIFQGCRWPTSEQQHHKLGALWFGHLHDLSEPDFNWQWQRTTESGNTLTETPAGPTYSKRNRQFRRRFLASKPIMKSALVSNGIDSPQQQIRGSWEETINLLERLEVDGTRCALIWQGERAEAGAQSSPMQRTADPLELIACRVESAGTLQNDAYTCQTMTLASTGSTDVPRPRASIAQIVFKEEF